MPSAERNYVPCLSAAALLYSDFSGDDDDATVAVPDDDAGGAKAAALLAATDILWPRLSHLPPREYTFRINCNGTEQSRKGAPEESSGRQAGRRQCSWGTRSRE